MGGPLQGYARDSLGYGIYPKDGFTCRIFTGPTGIVNPKQLQASVLIAAFKCQSCSSPASSHNGAKIEELESRLETASNTSVRGKDDEKEEEKDDDPIVTPDGQKVPFLKIFLGCPQKSELHCITTKGH